MFDKWLYQGQHVLTRTPLSGGWNGSKLGDITADPAKLMELKLQIPKFYVECKNREGLLSEEFFNWMSSGSPKRLTEWIVDTKKKAGEQTWFIILKGRGTEPWVFMPHHNMQIVHLPILHLMEDNVPYLMFPLKQLETVMMYNTIKQTIIGG